jgi:hypothetical protein
MHQNDAPASRVVEKLDSISKTHVWATRSCFRERLEENYEPEAPRAAALKMAKVAPWGSAMTEMRPTFSKSVGGI